MAVFKPDLSFTTIQDKQLKALESLNSICSKDFDINKDIYDTLEGKIPDTIFQSANLVLQGIDAIWSGRDFQAFSNSLDRNFSGLDSTIESSMRGVSDSIEDALEDIQDDNDEGENPTPEDSDPTEVLEDIKEQLKDLAKDLWDRAVTEADMYSDLYNQTLKFTGASEDESQQFRRDVIDIVSDLNGELGFIGGKLDPKEALSTMLAISNSTNISNLETLEALTRPLVLAQETTNTNIGELSKLSARLYTRYNFESKNLEKLVDHLRNTSEGKDVSEDAMVQAAATVEQAAGVYYQGNKDSIDAMMKATMTAQAFYESNYVDSTQYIDDMNTILKGNEVSIANALMKYGEEATTIRELVESGDQSNIEKAYELMLQATSERDVYQAGMFEGLSEDMVIAAKSWELTGSTMEEFLSDIDESITASDRASDKYVSIEDQIYNKISEATSYLATIQENLGIGMSDITLGVSVLGNVLSVLGGKGGGASILSALIGKGGGASALLGSGGGLAGLLSSAGPAALAIAAVGTMISAFVDTYEQVNEDKLKNFDNTTGSVGALGPDEAIGLNTTYTVDDKGNVIENTSWEAIPLSEYDHQGMIDHIEETYLKDLNTIAPDFEKDWWMTLLGMGMVKDREGKHQWWDYIPIIGALADNFIETPLRTGALDDEKNYNLEQIEFFKNLQGDSEQSRLYNAYYNKGMIPGQDQMEFLMDNWDAIVAASEEGKAVSGMNKKGLQTLVDRKKILGYKEGTNLLLEDQLAYLHKGEAVTPAEYNPANNMNELERLRAERDAESESGTAELLSVLTEIRNYMQYWKTDNEQRDLINSGRTMTSQRVNLMRYNSLGR